MRYSIAFKKSAVKELAAIPKPFNQNIASAIDNLITDHGQMV